MRQADELIITNTVDTALVGNAQVADEIIAIQQIDNILIIRATAEELRIVD